MAAAGSRVPGVLGQAVERHLHVCFFCGWVVGLKETRACEKYFNYALLCLTFCQAIFDKPNTNYICSVCRNGNNANLMQPGGLSNDSPDDAIAGLEEYPGGNTNTAIFQGKRQLNTWELKPQRTGVVRKTNTVPKAIKCHPDWSLIGSIIGAIV